MVPRWVFSIEVSIKRRSGASVDSRRMKKLLIVYHTMTGGTRQMAQAAAAGATRAAAVTVRLETAAAAGPEELLESSGYLFATAENLGAMSGLMKDFFDRSYYPVLELLQGRPYAALICAGSDGSNAARQIERIVTGWRLKPIAAALIVNTHAQTPESILRRKQIGAADLARCEELGATLAAGLELGIY
jgi:multimeric flavodoxin WrbA